MSASLSAPDSGSKCRVAICGAGIGGLVLAITIGKYDPSIPVDLYEAHGSISTDGVGLTFWRRTLEIVTELGLFDDLRQIFTHDPDNNRVPYSRRSDIREGGYMWYQRDRRHGPSAMHRQDMIGILESHLPPSCVVHTGKRLVGYLEPEQQDGHSAPPITLNFADGTVATADVLIGADGVRSAVRKSLFEAASEDKSSGDDDGTDLKQHIDATFTGMTLYRWLVPAEALKKESPQHPSLQDLVTYHGKGMFCVTYSIAKGTMINNVATVYDPSLMGTYYEGRWVSDASHEELAGYFDDFEPDARTLVKLCEKPSKWALHVVKPLPFYVRKRVALIGDACHAMAPYFGAGAGQAIEDAFVLGRLIAHPLTTLSCIPEAFRVYQDIRLSFTSSIARLSLSMGQLYSFMEPGHYDGTRKEDDLDDTGISAYEREGMETLKQEVTRRWDSIEWSSGALQVWERAESRLQAVVRENSS